MNYYEALNLLEIKDGYDEDTLKKAYRRKAKLYHPDTTSIKDEVYAKEMMQKINQAHDTLLNHLKNGGYFSYKRDEQYSDKINNSAYIIMKKKELEKYLPIKHLELFNIEPYASYLIKIKNIINDFSKISPYRDIITLEFLYKCAQSMVRNVIWDFYNLFCKLNNIKNEPNIDILNSNFDEFYEKLLEAKKQQKALENYYIGKCESLKKYMPQKDNEYYHDYYQKIIELISHFNNLNWISILDINNEYNFIINSIKNMYLQLKAKFKHDFNIDGHDLDNLNYYCNLDAFYEQLLIIKDKDNLEISLKNRIEKEIEKYKEHNGYDYVKIEIEEIKNQVYQNILNNQDLKKQFIEDQNNQSFINIFNQMHERIIKAFAEALNYLKQFNDLEKQVQEINNPEITSFFNYAKDSFMNGQSFITTLRNINELGKLIVLNEKRELLKQKIIETFNDLQKESPKEFNKKKLEYILWYIESLHRLSEIPNIIELVDNDQIKVIISLIMKTSLLDSLNEYLEKNANDIIFKEIINNDHNKISFGITNNKNKY